jgi:NADH:ubiquinone oxidoreductase subunit H
MLLSFLAYSSVLKMEVICSSETLVDFPWNTRRNIPDDRLFIVTAVIASNLTLNMSDMNTELVPQFFVKFSSIKFYGNLSNGFLIAPRVPTDGQIKRA